MGAKDILVVDDEQDMRIFVSTVVETLGWTPVAAASGTEALDHAQSNPPALIILDVMMPQIDDGLQTYQRLKSDEALAAIPVIMLSAIAKKTFFHSIRLLTPSAGIPLPEPEAYLEKPPDVRELGQLITALLPDHS